MAKPLLRQAWPLLCLLPIVACSDSGGDSGSLAPRADTDRDGLPDVLERSLGSDPRDPDSPIVEGADDDDTPEGPGPDGMPDGLEGYLLARGAVPPITHASDTDGDQVPDYLEVSSALDPFDFDVPLVNGSADQANAGGPALDDISDALESYLLRRGATPPLTQLSDSDADGIPDVLEVRSGSEPFVAASPAYGRAHDLDHDGVPDWLERKIGANLLDPNFPTFDGADDDDGGLLGPDGDGVLDGLEGWLSRSGGSAPVTALDDSDGDRLPDVAEVRAGSWPYDAASPLADGKEDDDGDGISNALEFVLRSKGARATTRTTDSDADRVPDFAEVLAGFDPFDAASPVLFGHSDLDGDGILDYLELVERFDPLDPTSPDPDGGRDVDDATGPARDPLSDGMEALMIARGSTAPVTTYTDSDGDGVTDFIELQLVSDPFDADSPLRDGGDDQDDEIGPGGDGISDAAESVLLGLGITGTLDPTRNSDEDVIPDALELAIGSNPLDGRSPHSSRNPDVDGDGVVDYLELLLGFDPLSADVPVASGGLDGDADGLSDALEETLRLTSTPEPVGPLSDSDGDGLADHLEVRFASDRHDPDHPVRDGGLDVDDRNGPAGDGLSDALEFFLVAGGATRPVTTRSDTDGDVLPDFLEVSLALDPFDAGSPLEDGRGDEDGDGVSNALEFVLLRLGATAPVDGRTDSDLDGAPDHLEFFAGGDPFDPDQPVADGANDSDGDLLSDALENVLVALGARPPLDSRSDTDGDGIADAFEVRIGTHPLRGDHPLANGALDTNDATGPRDTLSDGLEAALITLGATPPVTRASDTDGDGAPDHLEALAVALPSDGDDPLPGGAADVDGDLLSGALEIVLARLGGATPLDSGSDTDGDGAPDHLEVALAAHPVDGDVPILRGDGANFDVDERNGPNGDGLSDAFELLLVTLGCQAPVTASSDTDGDGLPDYFEVRVGTRPLDGDSPLPGGSGDSDDATGPAGDGISDALEALLIARGASGPVTLETDTDGDGVPDFFEVIKGSDPFDPADEIPPGTRPRAVDLTVSGVPLADRPFTGTYRYEDSELDPEGISTFRWLRNGVPIPGATERTYVLAAADLGTTLTFEVTPVARFAYPPETLVGLPATRATTIPVPSFPRGGGGPGGVGTADGASDLRLWLRPDLGTELSGADVTTWRDQSGYRRDATTVNANRRPDLVAGAGLRGTPVLRFNGASQLILPRPVEEDLSFVAAFTTTSTASNGTWWLAPAILGGEVSGGCGDFQFGINGGKPQFTVTDTSITTGNTFSNGQPHVMTATRVMSTGRIRLYVDGTQRSSGTAQTILLDCPANLYLGSSIANDGYWTGDLHELVAFDHVLKESERNLLEAYFAARYGTNPSVDLYDHAATHGWDVAGIGRVSSTDLVSEAEGRGIVRIGAADALSDGDYLVWGTDLPDDFGLSDEVPPTRELRLRRVWARTLTDGGAGDGVGRVNVRFRVAGLFFSPNPLDFALLQDEDGDFSNALIAPELGLYDSEAQTIEFRGVDLSQQTYFTLAVRPL